MEARIAKKKNLAGFIRPQSLASAVFRNIR